MILINFKKTFVLAMLLFAVTICSGCGNNGTSSSISNPPKQNQPSTQSQNSTAASNSDSSTETIPKVSGKYLLFKVIEDGEEMSAEEFDEDEFSITFNDNGTGFTIGEGDLRSDFTWSQSGKKITLKADGESINITIEGNMITVRDDDMTMVFTK